MKTNGTKQKKIHETLFSHAFRYTEYRFMYVEDCMQKREEKKHETKPNRFSIFTRILMFY